MSSVYAPLRKMCYRTVPSTKNWEFTFLLFRREMTLNNTGRPPYDYKDLLKLYLYGYLYRIRSSRRLEAETRRNIEVMWLLHKLSPDHRTIARFRSDNPKALKNVFRNFVKMCDKLGLYGKELQSVDGSKFKAVNAKDRNFTMEKLEDRLKRIDTKIEEYLKELDQADDDEAAEEEMSPEDIKRIISEMKEHLVEVSEQVLKETTDAERSLPDSDDLLMPANEKKEEKAEKEKSNKETRRKLEELKERKKLYEGYKQELEETGETQKSLTDSFSRLMPSNGKMEVSVNIEVAVDSKHKLISEFEVINKTNDLNQLSPMIEKVQEILGTEAIAYTADKGYASGTDLAKALLLGAELHVAGTDYDICLPCEEGEAAEIESHKEGKCVYLKDRNIAICPMGEVLRPGHYRKEKRVAVFHNSQACQGCPCPCTTEERGYRFEITVAEGDFKKEYNDKGLFVKQVRIVPDKNIYAQRKCLSEHPFGTIKRTMDAGYCLLKGEEKIRGEFSLVFLSYNLKRVINILGCKKLLEEMRKIVS